MLARSPFLVVVGASACAAAVAYVLTPPKRRRAALQSLYGLRRLSRVAAFGLGAMWEYKCLEWDAERTGLDEKSEEYATLKRVVDVTVTEKFLALSLANGVGFLKMAQYMSTQQALPPELSSILAQAQDQGRSLPFAQIADVFFEDTGKRPEDVFASIEELPRAAASLAQVHHAVTKDGAHVAVKIQYPYLHELILLDLAALRIMLDVIEWYWPDYGFAWLLPEFERQALCEIDFLQEASNSERLGRMFASDSRVRVPAIRRDLSSNRVLVMEWIDGCKINDVEALQRMGVDKGALARKVTSTFASMVHVHGFVHCDPHPGNVFVRGGPADWQLVILDHGMYRQLSVGFRRAYCDLYKAMLLNDPDSARIACLALGMAPDDVAVAFTALGRTPTESDRAAMKARYGGPGNVVGAEVTALLRRLPRDLLFVSRSVDMVRHLNRSLGGTQRDRMRATGEAAVRGMTLTDAAIAAGLQGHGSSLGGGAEIVASIALADEGFDATQKGRGASSRFWSLVEALRPARSRPRLTYAAALAQGAVKFEPTESEVLAAARSVPATLWEAAVAEYRVFWLRARLSLVDAAMVAVPRVWTAVSAVRGGLQRVGVLAPLPPPPVVEDSVDGSAQAGGASAAETPSSSRDDGGQGQRRSRWRRRNEDPG